MSLNKLNYVDQVTVIPASNLNDIQDAIIELEGDVGELGTEIEGKADASSVYTKTEADALLSAKADSSDVYSKTEADALLNAKADASDTYTKTEVDTALSGKASASDLEELEEEVADYRQMYLDSLIHTTASGAIASFSDGFADAPMDFCTASIEPVQDLHGQASPYPAGGGKNKLNAVTSNMLDYGTYTNYSFNDATGVMSFSGNTLCGFIVPVLPSTQYTYSFKKSSTDGFAMRVREYSALPTSWSDSSFIVQSVGSNKSASGTVSETFTTTATTTYIIAAVYRQGETTETLSEFQVELGSTVTAWSPYSNICPISGFTGAEVVRSGKNLLPMTAYEGVAYNPTEGAVFSMTPKETQPTDNGDGTFTITFTSSWKYYCFVMPLVNGQTYAYKIQYASTGQAGSTIGYLDKDMKVLTKVNATDASKTLNATATGTDERKYLYLCISNRGTATATITITNPQAELGSTSSDYEPYTADTYSVTWEDEAGTVYGGSVDLVSGVLTVTHTYRLFDGSENWTKYATREYCYQIKVGDNAFGIDNIVRLMSNKYVGRPYYGPSTPQIETLDNGIYSADDSRIRVFDKRFTTLEDFKASLATENLQLVYELATPTTYQLTPQEIKTLLGSNNVWADTGDTSVGYVANTKLYIDSRL